VTKKEINKKEISEKYIERGCGRYKMERIVDYGIPQHTEDG
jgi:hypothetical protein